MNVSKHWQPLCAGKDEEFEEEEAEEEEEEIRL